MRWFPLALFIAACSSRGSTVDASADLAGGYVCTVTQVRCGSCAEPWPMGFAGTSGVAFVMSIEGNTVDAPGWFHCDGTWSGDQFACMIQGKSCSQPDCGAIPWAILRSGTYPQNGMPIPAGQLWAGTYVPGTPSGNGFNASCSP